MTTPALKRSIRHAAFAAAALFMAPAFAHNGDNHAVLSLSAGFVHPFSGVDHLLAMLAVGVWAAQNRRPAVWLLPIVFPLMMGLGAILSFLGLSISGVEAGIAGSLAVMGLLTAFAIRLPVRISIAMVSLFAMAHGLAHGAELPQGSSFAFYAAGFILATALLHLLGVMIGAIGTKNIIKHGIRLSGAAAAATGMVLLIPLV
ncbi:MAG: ureJ [Herminiimonas sp.]|jgi:urease accessory protein|nr:ureJ [Herminiimonas sp.]